MAAVSVASHVAAHDHFVGLIVFVHVVVEKLTDVVRNDIENDFYIVFMQNLNHFTQFCQIAEVRIDRFEILRPVAVITCDTCVGIDVFNDRTYPNCRHTELFEVVDIVDYPLKIAAIPGCERLFIHIVVVVDVAVGKTVGDKLINNLVAPVGDMVRNFYRTFDNACVNARNKNNRQNKNQKKSRFIHKSLQQKNAEL